MPEILISSGNLPFVLFIAFVFMLLIQLFFYWIIFSRLAFRKIKKIETGTRGVSVVICARDACHFLKENLPLILAQDHPDFEVVVVNNSSDDDSSFYLNKLAEDHRNLKIVEIPHNYNFFTGKKFPLSIGIKSAGKELVLLTDADCRPASNQWIRLMQNALERDKKIILGYGAYDKKKGFLNRLIRFDTAHIGVQYLSYALSGIPYMGVGRNMGYLRSLFFQNKGFISHYNISSGDDDLFVNRTATRSNTAVVLDPDSFTLSEPKTSFRLWMIQKRRHLSTGKYYRFRHKFMLGLYGTSTVLFLGLFTALLVLKFSIYLACGVLALRVISQWFVFSYSFQKLKEPGLWIIVPLLEIILLVINLYLSVIVFFSKPQKWK